jgi:hypothetical protein
MNLEGRGGGGGGRCAVAVSEGKARSSGYIDLIESARRSRRRPRNVSPKRFSRYYTVTILAGRRLAYFSAGSFSGAREPFA